ncbi:FAD/FMN-containing dehydrogenase [Lipingzhangella halophila]|uniref:FAD/FMN-containing dehydrogenase n=1 Tax=Lipingzhangella halophila TaxID=1783352 RepID=A0A7W7RIW4_9ACTN|nr:FAD-binding oxidoreductase [Lipingzhangella halophila]MBB4932246.1 FAD/FMN-containing dehydrogenase [Lipingzhangella halophila]
MTDTVDIHIETFRTRFGGTVLTGTDAGYDSARSLWNGAFDRHPRLIARCGSADDVAAAIGFAAAEGLEVSVRGGGHSLSGVSVVENGLMIDLSPMNQVSVDPDTRRAVCGGGAALADLDAATQEHGLAVTAGIVSHTGVGGLTLGGGLGWLMRSFGLTIDNLVAAEVVLADGRVVRAAEDERPDLFWALRGGGGNFGVVTRFEYRLHPVGPQVHVGLFFWPLERSREALRLSRDVAEALPRNANAIIGAGLSAPPAPFVPEQYHHLAGCALILTGFGSAAEHERLIRPVRETRPLFEFVTPMPYVQLQQMLNESAPWGILDYDKGLYLDELTEEAIGVIAEHLPRKTSSMSFVPMFALGGAVSDTADADTAFGGSRAARFALAISAIAPIQEMLDVDREWARSFWSALQPYSSGAGSYVNFMSEYEDDRVRAAYGEEKYTRLARVKAEYDPDNVFHLNANIKPAVGTVPPPR